MTTTTDRTGRNAQRPRFRLLHKLLAAVAALCALLALALLFFVEPRTNAAFRDRSAVLIEHGVTAMREIATRQAEQHRVWSLELARLPEAERQSALEKRAAQARERASRELDEALADLRYEQEQLLRAFEQDLRAVHFELLALSLAAAAIVLALGLHRLVVKPVRELQRATRRVADGDLSPVDGPATAADDEIGELAADFAAMTDQLRRSRADLDALNRGLEQQVAQKTKELTHAAKMASLGTLAGGLAHEFHNLIGGIRGCAKEARADAKDDDARATIDVILRATDRATAIVDQLKCFAKQDRVTRRRSDLAKIAQDAIALLQPEARRRGVALEARFENELPATVDEGALHQVFVNLITNALQATPNGGRVEVEGVAVDGRVGVCVRDTGCGIPDDQLPRVFDPFFTTRADATDPALRGSGLGLSVSLGIVESHGGEMTVESRIEQGSSFRVLLPRA
jgi:two-component system NtrC family sensor kinase